MPKGEVARGEQAGLIEKLRCLEVRQAAVQSFLRQVGEGLEQGKGHLGANHGCRLQEVLCLGR